MTETNLDTQYFKDRLEKEMKELIEELQDLGRINPDNPNDWEAVQEELNVLSADSNEVADKMEEYEADTATLKEVETRFNFVKRALEKIEKGTYGIDEVDGEAIPEERLRANPAARTKIENVYKLEDGLS
ncbi:MAG: hypothetical protein WDZ70_00250 [Candidatus Paceibacterota bacterium]